jgi:lycopene cyclase domain-containing protein
MPEYTVLAVVSVLAVVAIELRWARTGIFATAQFWLSMLIVVGFQVLVDGWLTKLSDPIVLYDERETSGIRFPWDIPVEDFLFGFAMVTLTLLLWLTSARRERPAHAPETSAHDPVTSPQEDL